MPDSQFNYCQGRTSELEQFLSGVPEYNMRTRTAFVKKEEKSSVALNNLSASSDAKGCHSNRGFNADVSDPVFLAGQSPKKARGKESSKHFGVRFRPDLQKWVAEIRVAEWKTVDKKVWLGTFDSEEGAARAVDAARKLLKCKKKRPANFPCDSLASYAEKIPTNLNLNNLRDDSMFKEVTLFVKRKAQEYAASFCPNKTACISISTDQILAQYNSLQETPQKFSSQEDNMSDMASYVGTSYGSSTYNSYNTQLGLINNYDAQWMSSPSVTYSCSTSSSPGTSPDSDHKSWLYVNSDFINCRQAPEMIEEQSVEGDWTAINIQSANATNIAENFEGTVWEGQNMATEVQPYTLQDHQYWLPEVGDLFLFPNDDEFFDDQTAMEIVPSNELLYLESQNHTHSIGDTSLAEWMTQQNFTSYSLMSSMDLSTQVC
ncbi:hypothetical protein M758_1G081800 [Ceratodon purpureus]|nr:hypothetical protein M758_1G081800 [Ceratodon purpureus]KAG0629165.1 hypothetical protein M758_1G081800 [Ceratodon purpureus]